MDQVSQHFSAATGTKARDFDDGASETSEQTIKDEAVLTYEENYGMDEQAAKGEPIRGRKYMLFTMVAMLILTIIVGMNANIQALEKIRDQKLDNQVTGIDRKKVEPTQPQPADSTTKTTDSTTTKTDDKKTEEAAPAKTEETKTTTDTAGTETKKEGEAEATKESSTTKEGEASK